MARLSDRFIRLPPPLALVVQRLAACELWIIGPLVLASIASERVLLPALLVASVFWLLRWLAYGRLSRPTPADIPLALLVALLPLSLWMTSQPAITFPQVFRVLLGIAGYYAVVNWATTRQRINLLLLGLAAIGALLALLAPFAVEWFVGKLPFVPEAIYQRFTVLVAERIHPNVMAGHLLVLLFCALGLWSAGQSVAWYYRSLALLALLLAASMLLLTQSRGALLALLPMLALFVVLRWRRGWLLVGGGAGLLAVSLAGLLLAGILSLPELLAGGEMQNTLAGRQEIWASALAIIGDFPLTGVGMGLYGLYGATLYPLVLFSPGEIPHAHNVFLQIAVDVGVPGLLVWLSMVLLLARGLVGVYRQSGTTGDVWERSSSAALLCSGGALLLHGLTDAVTWGMVRPSILVWLVLGAAAAIAIRPAAAVTAVGDQHQPGPSSASAKTH